MWNNHSMKKVARYGTETHQGKLALNEPRTVFPKRIMTFSLL